MKVYYTDRFEGGRAESHRLLEEALSEYMGDADKAKVLTRRLKTGEKGKPYIEGFKHFSISHTGRIWAVLIADCECGLDIQLSRKCDALAIAKRIFAPEDVEAVTSSKEFFRLWTRREALVKAMGGSVYETGLPSVIPSGISVNGYDYSLSDIDIPDLPDLYASICLRDESPKTPLYIRLDEKH